MFAPTQVPLRCFDALGRKDFNSLVQQVPQKAMLKALQSFINTVDLVEVAEGELDLEKLCQGDSGNCEVKEHEVTTPLPPVPIFTESDVPVPMEGQENQDLAIPSGAVSGDCEETMKPTSSDGVFRLQHEFS